MKTVKPLDFAICLPRISKQEGAPWTSPRTLPIKHWCVSARSGSAMAIGKEESQNADCSNWQDSSSLSSTRAIPERAAFSQLRSRAKELGVRHGKFLPP